MKIAVFYNKILAGYLEKTDSGYFFYYTEDYLKDSSTKPISLSFPKINKIFHSDNLFPFFHGFITEGITSKIQSRKLRIDEKNYFKRLVMISTHDNIGPVTLGKVK